MVKVKHILLNDIIYRLLFGVIRFAWTMLFTLYYNDNSYSPYSWHGGIVFFYRRRLKYGIWYLYHWPRSKVIYLNQYGFTRLCIYMINVRAMHISPNQHMSPHKSHRSDIYIYIYIELDWHWTWSCCLFQWKISWWRHPMETFSALLAFCAGNSPVTVEFHTQRPVTRSSDVVFDLRLNKQLSQQSWSWWFETPSHPLCRHCNVTKCIRMTVTYEI